MKMRFSLSLIIVGVCASGILGQRRVSLEEYSIYGAALIEFHREDRERFCTVSEIVILSSCAEPGLVILSTTKGRSSWSLGKDKPNMQGLSTDFLQANQTNSILQHRIPLRFHYDIISQEELNNLLDKSKADYEIRNADLKENCRSGVCDSAWKLFYERFPHTYQYYQLSRIGFSNNRRFAIVEIVGKGSGCLSSGWTIWLKKYRKAWLVYQLSGGSGDC